MGEQILIQLNKLRKRTYAILCAIYMFEFLFAFGVMLLMSRFEDGLYTMIILILSIPMFILTYQYINPVIMKTYRDAYKNEVIPYLMDESLESIKYNHEKGLNINEIVELDLFDTTVSYKTEDLLTGTLLGINFQCADLNVIGSGRNNQQFYGQWYVFDFNKQFKGITHIIEKNDMQLLTEERSSFHKPAGDYINDLKRIKLANQAFNKWFKVYTNHEHYAMYILTPHFLENVMKLESRHYGRLFISFYKNKVHIAVHNANDYMEPPLNEEITKKSFKQHADIKTIKSIIKELKLNVKLFFD
ncbi:DUF3137 domain-containing protein [Haloplasma contractile]|uniref:Galanin protein n=1 Tax=Haloplasma contractile SSD-17B TaxID=1033810 RepID=U2E7P5_9MOLU|nr:DUF3137 domain-containing protein [Haloplasma contractile]ERJ11223.1 hypothetical protein HLPCO_002792 [Haloplasma contractile SSD-17B]